MRKKLEDLWEISKDKKKRRNIFEVIAKVWLGKK